ncbi:hypothetical protein D043_4349A, partial [Vibrio parahaemolyticus EKP-021]
MRFCVGRDAKSYDFSLIFVYFQ